jgi:hypothetical protein
MKPLQTCLVSMTGTGRKGLRLTNTLAYLSGAFLVKQIKVCSYWDNKFFLVINEIGQTGRVFVLIQYSKLV